MIVTRPQPQADDWVAQLALLGIDAAALPLLGIAAPADPQMVRAAWSTLAQMRLAMFVSPSAVERFFALAPAVPTGASAVWPDAAWAGGTGPGTAAALRRCGVPDEAIICPDVGSPGFDSEALWQLLRDRCDWCGAQVLIVRGEGGRDWLAQTLRGQGATVGFVEAYRRTAPLLDEAGRRCLAAALTQPAMHVWLFSSSEAVQHLPALATQADWASAQALATHPRIAQAARNIGFGRVDTLPPSPAAIADWVRLSIQSART